MEFEPWIVQPTVSSSTDYVIPAGKYFPLHCVLYYITQINPEPPYRVCN
jgi:hypothetical protein